MYTPTEYMGFFKHIYKSNYPQIIIVSWKLFSVHRHPFFSLPLKSDHNMFCNVLYSLTIFLSMSIKLTRSFLWDSTEWKLCNKVRFVKHLQHILASRRY